MSYIKKETEDNITEINTYIASINSEIRALKESMNGKMEILKKMVEVMGVFNTDLEKIKSEIEYSRSDVMDLKKFINDAFLLDATQETPANTKSTNKKTSAININVTINGEEI